LIDYNPFFYIIDGFRYGFIGSSDSSIIFGVYFITSLNVTMWALTFYLFKSGWRLKT
jgi:ABC-2 type transport system permease protein